MALDGDPSARTLHSHAHIGGRASRVVGGVAIGAGALAGAQSIETDTGIDDVICFGMVVIAAILAISGFVLRDQRG